MHPFARARERTRALNAAKIERIFAKPFVASLEGHSDAVEVLVRKPKSLTTVASASWNGGVYPFPSPPFWSLSLDHSWITIDTPSVLDIIIHDLQQRAEILTLRGAHKGKASGLCFSGENGDRFLSCGVDRTVKLWNTPAGLEQDTGVRLSLLHV
jgi:WD repeat and SOF domain-containing protein 1